MQKNSGEKLDYNGSSLEVSIRMSLLPEKCFCFSLRRGTIAQGVLCLVTSSINVLIVLTGLGDFLDRRIYDFCWPNEDCYDKLKALEKTLAIANIVINAFFYMFSILLLIGVRDNKPQYMVPFMFVQGLVISALVPSALTALVICARAGSCLEWLAISFCSLVYISINIYLALAVRAYYHKMMKTTASKESACMKESFDTKKELTLEDFVF
ncbi:uncharacterized protein LOC135196209 [Macrobrachium nipponense]|uniref:uncharacterized protein LOC135196209 n=1 Tax=Macrobrachium nipponense TaxID=159736 RepID=UPI0030C82AA6